MAGDPFYGSAQWKALRAKVLFMWRRDNKPCAYCGEVMGQNQRVIVDHVINRKRRPDLSLVVSNLCVVHFQCNAKKYHHVEVNDKKDIDINGLPEDWR